MLSLVNVTFGWNKFFSLSHIISKDGVVVDLSKVEVVMIGIRQRTLAKLEAF